MRTIQIKKKKVKEEEEEEGGGTKITHVHRQNDLVDLCVYFPMCYSIVALIIPN